MEALEDVVGVVVVAVVTIVRDREPRRPEAGGPRARHVVAQRVPDVQRPLGFRVERGQCAVERLGCGLWRGGFAGVNVGFEGVVDVEGCEFLLLGRPPAVRDQADAAVLAGPFQRCLRAGSKGDGGVIGRVVVCPREHVRTVDFTVVVLARSSKGLRQEVDVVVGVLDFIGGGPELGGITELLDARVGERRREYGVRVLIVRQQRSVEIETDRRNRRRRHVERPPSTNITLRTDRADAAGGFATFKPPRTERHAMTRSVWLKADNAVGDWESRKKRITAGLEAGVDWVLVDAEDVSRVRDLGQVSVAAFETAGPDVIGDAEDDPEATVVGKNGEGDGTADLPPDHSGSADLSTLRRGDADTAYVRVFNQDYESFAESAAEAADHTLVVSEDWTIIPLENLIARIGDETELVAGVETAEEARTAFETLETGADGVLLDSDDSDEIRRTVEVRDEAEREQLDLEWAEVTAIERVGSADRVCVDTGSLMDGDEGMLVGSMSRGLFFVHAETAESPYVASRPFRVNAGAVHAYVRTPGGGTKYLAELKSGDEVQVVDTDGRAREAVVGRAKIERRPMFRIEAEVAHDAESDDGPETVDEAESGESDATPKGDRIETLLQNAETIKIATRDGPRAVTDLEVGDEVRVHYEEGARHFGETVDERIVEQ